MREAYRILIKKRKTSARVKGISRRKEPALACRLQKHDPQSESGDRDRLHEGQPSSKDSFEGIGRSSQSLSVSPLPAFQSSNETHAGRISQKAQDGRGRLPCSSRSAERERDHGKGRLQ